MKLQMSLTCKVKNIRNQFLIIFLELCVICLILFSISSCCKPDVRSEDYLENKTTSKITAKSYKSGLDQAVLEISQSSKIEIIPSNNMGVNADADSILIVFDNNKKIIHYSKEISTIGKNTEAIEYDNPRNLFNGKGITEVSKALDCGGSFTTYTYTFTDDDYANAK